MSSFTSSGEYEITTVRGGVKCKLFDKIPMKNGLLRQPGNRLSLLVVLCTCDDQWVKSLR